VSNCNIFVSPSGIGKHCSSGSVGSSEEALPGGQTSDGNFQTIERAVSADCVNNSKLFDRKGNGRWSSEESGFADIECEVLQSGLSPVHELR